MNSLSLRSCQPLRPRWLVFLPLVLALSACGIQPLLSRPDEVTPSNVNADATLTPATRITRDLVRLPSPEFKVPVAVYAFRDQTGQFKGQPDSNLSNAVTQGAAAILVKALLDSGWYLPIEREGFQNLLTERRVARAIETPADKGKPGSSYPVLMPAHFILEGGIVGFESNVRTGGKGANLLGIGAETKYRVDQVTVGLRSVDVRTGQIVNSVSVTKTIFSHEVSSSIYKFVAYKTLLQAEGGYSTNEPGQLAVKAAIEAAVIHLTLQGVRDRAWALRTDSDWYVPLVQSYMRESELQLADEDTVATLPDQPVHMRASSLVKAPQLPLQMTQQPMASPSNSSGGTEAAPMGKPVPLSPDILRNRETGSAPVVRPPVAKDSPPAEITAVVSSLSLDNQ
jgi:curli production assembly/transport component CsgG